MKSIQNIPTSRVWKIAQSVIALSLAAAVAGGISIREAQAATFTVTNTADLCLGVPCLDSLRKAIENANENPGADLIVFNIPGLGVQRIALGPSLRITDTVFIDGWSQGGAGYTGPPLIELAYPGTTEVGSIGLPAEPRGGFVIYSSNSTVSGLIINGVRTLPHPLPGFPPSLGYGINIQGDNNTIQGCYIGTTANGLATLPNEGDGIYINRGSVNNLIGGTAAGARNIIAGNGSGGLGAGGIRIDGTDNSVIGNYVGVGADGFTDLGNYAYGIVVGNARNQIGGLPFGEITRGNVISGNGDGGIKIGVDGGVGLDAVDNVIQGNHIGVGANGSTPVPNSANGIVVDVGNNNLIGGVPVSGFEAGNIIAFNNHSGIRVGVGTGNRISANRIHSNGPGGFNLLGIDLFSGSGYGLTLNDPCDLDSGANNLQNFPLVTSALSFGGTTTIHGSLESVPDLTYSVEFFSNTACDISGHGEGRTYLGRTNVSIIRPGCKGTFNVTFPEPVTPGHFITATATDPNGNTSEFSACRLVTASTLQFEATNFSVNEGDSTATVTVTRTGSTVSAANVNYATSAGTATPGADYTETSGLLSFGIGEVTKTFSIPILDDTVAEANETVNLGLQNVTGAGAALGTPSTATLTILDNDGCTYSIDPTAINSSATGGTGSVSVTSSSGCQWTAVSNAAWISVTGGSTGAGNGTVNYTVATNTGVGRIGTVTIGGQTFTVNQAAVSLGVAPFDFDGDGKTDIGIFRTALAEWWINRSSNGLTFALQFGSSTDRITPADYTGDGQADIAFFRPASGEWYVLRSEDFSFFALPFGTNGDVPVPADYDADGEADFAVFRPSTSTWFISQSSGAPTQIVQFGISGDQPVVADYDGDGNADVGIFRPGANEWWIQRSTAGLLAIQFGISTDKAVQGDYTGDGKADIAIWRPTTGEWFIVRSEDFSFYGFPFGTNGDTVAPGDYDGDGKFDATVFRPSSATWFISRTTAGTQIVQFGATGDRPIPNAFVP